VPSKTDGIAHTFGINLESAAIRAQTADGGKWFRRIADIARRTN